MSPNLELPLAIEPPRAVLLGTLRDRVAAAEVAVRRALAGICAIPGCEIGWLQDEVEECLDSFPEWALPLAQDCRRMVREATRRDTKQGYDTWSPEMLARYIAAVGALACALEQLHHAHAEFCRAETHAYLQARAVV